MQRAPVDLLGAPARQEGAQIAWSEADEVGDRRRRAEALGQEGEKLPDVAPIRLQRQGGEPALVAQVGEPRGHERGEIGRGRQGGDFERRRHGPTMRRLG